MSQLENFLEEAKYALDYNKEPERTPYNLTPNRVGAIGLRNRVAAMASISAKYRKGNLLEIGAHIGETSAMLARVALTYGRNLIVVDPWLDTLAGIEADARYQMYMERIHRFGDLVTTIRARSQSPEALSAIYESTLCFVLVDGDHSYTEAFRDMLSVAHCNGFICIDDVGLHGDGAGVRRALAKAKEKLGWAELRPPYRSRETYVYCPPPQRI